MTSNLHSQIDALQEFRDSIQNSLTRRNYESRVANFIKRLDVEGGTLREKATRFAELAKKDTTWATLQIASYMNYQKTRADNNEISQSTLPNYFKPIKLFCIEFMFNSHPPHISFTVPFRSRTTDRIETVLVLGD